MIIPILMYHALSHVPEVNKYTLDKKEFQNHLEFFHANHYKCITADEYYLNCSDSLSAIPEKSVLLTFDDGHESDYTFALPLLNKYNFKATFFITTDWIGKLGYMNSYQLQVLKDEGMSVQSHAKSHSFLDKKHAVVLNQELELSKKILEQTLGSAISFLSFPGGRYNEKVIRYAQRNDYAALFSSEPFAFKQYGDTYLFGRYAMKQGAANTNMQKILDMNICTRLGSKASYYGKYICKKTFSTNLYYYLWGKLIKKS